MSWKFVSAAAVVALLLGCRIATASVQLNIDTEYNDAGAAYPPSGTAPWARVEVYDYADSLNTTDYPNLWTYNLTSNDVLVVISSLVKTSAESIEAVGFNFVKTNSVDAADLNPGGLQEFNDFEVMLKEGAFQDPTISYNQGIDSSNPFNIKFNFGQPGVGAFDGNEKVYIKLKYDSAISATDFVDTTAIDDDHLDAYYAAAHVLGVPVSGDNPSQQSFVAKLDGGTPEGGPVPPVPEPATLAIWGLGLGIAGLVSLRRKK